MKSANKTPSSKKDCSNKASSNSNIKSFFTKTVNNSLVRSKSEVDEEDNINMLQRTSNNSIQKENLKHQQQQKQDEDEIHKTKKEIQQAQEAKEREFRIQQDILKTRQENNRLLSAASSSNVSNVSDKLFVKPNIFFLARATSTSSSKTSMIKNDKKNSSSELINSICDFAAMGNTNNSEGGHGTLNSSFPCMIQHTGLDSVIYDIKLYKTQIKNLATVPIFDRSILTKYSIDIGTSYSILSTTNIIDDKSIYISNNEFSSNCTSEYSCSFQPRSRIRASNRPAPASCHMYPFSQAAFNLRACWLSWIIHNYLKPYYQSNSEFYLKSLSFNLSTSYTQFESLVITDKSRMNLLDWLGKWALKRKSRLIQRTEVISCNKRKNTRNFKIDINKNKQVFKNKKSKHVSRYDEDEEGEFSDDIDDSTEEEISDSYDSDCDETSQNSYNIDREDISNVMIIQGSSGSGKSTSVYECANKLGFKVIEVNASQARNGTLIKKMISEAAQSAHIFDSSLSNVTDTYSSTIRKIATTSEPSEGEINILSECNLILFDEVDIVFEDEDSQLYSSIQQLARISKCPILLTTEKSLDFFKALDASILIFTRPDPLKDASSILNKSIAARSKASFEVSVDNYTNSPLLEVICSITDGCLRSCDATIDCLQEIFSSSKRFNKIIDLTQEEEDGVVDITKMLKMSFGTHLNEQECLDFAQFDQIEKLIHSSDTINYEIVSDINGVTPVSCQLLAPIIHGIEPRSGLCCGGFIVNIVGCNFLQRSFDLNKDHSCCEIEVFLNNEIPCPSVIKSNSLIVVSMPQVDKSGIYTFSLHLKMKLPTSKYPTICSRSEFCGIGKSWISLKHRKFPSFKVGNRISTFSFEDFINAGESNLDLGISKKERKIQNELFPSEVKSVKRLRRTNCTISKNLNEDSDDEYLCNMEEINIPSSNFIRKKISINCEDGDNSEDDDVDESYQVVANDLIGTPIPDEKELFELNNALFDAMKCALKVLLNCRISEPFLQPVNDDIAPNYSSIISTPIDLGLIESYFRDGRYMKPICSQTIVGKFCDISAFVEDIRLVWKNCLTYNLNNSEYVKSSYLLNYMFETSLRSNLLTNVKTEYLKFISKTETSEINNSLNTEEIDSTNIFRTSVHITFNDVAILNIPNCDLFDDQQYLKLRNSLHDIDTITDLQNVNDKIIASTIHEAFLKEAVSSDDLNKSLLEIEPKRVSLALKDDKCSGLEYENDEDISICVFTSPYACNNATVNSNWLEEQRNTENALIDLCRILDIFSDSDIIQDFVLQSCNYACYDADEVDEIKIEQNESSDSVCELIKSTIPQSSVDNNISFAQYYKSGNQLVEYSSSIRKLAIHEFSNSNLKWDNFCSKVSPALTACSSSSSQLNNKPIYQLNRKTSMAYTLYNSWLDSHYLAFQLERLKYIQLAQSLLANYNCSKYQNDIARNSIVAGEHIRSLCFLASTIALDILPMIKNICNIEFINDEYHFAVDSSTSSTSADTFSTRRSTRRGKVEIKEYVRYAYIKNILNIQDENIITEIF